MMNRYNSPPRPYGYSPAPPPMPFSEPFRHTQQPYPPYPATPDRMSPVRGPARGDMRRQDMGSRQEGKSKPNFLSKLKGKNKKSEEAVPASLFSLPAGSSRKTASADTSRTGTGFLQNLTNPAALSTMLDNTQKVLQAAESIGPMVQQYGPMLKSIPSVWKFFTKEEETQAGSVSDIQPQNIHTAPEKKNDVQRKLSHMRPKAPIHHQQTGAAEQAAPTKEGYRAGESKPRLFV